ncbi:hypothetical protein ACLB1R_13085 [Escherichia coli]
MPVVWAADFYTGGGESINLYAPAEGMFLPDTKDKRKRFPLHENKGRECALVINQ